MSGARSRAREIARFRRGSVYGCVYRIDAADRVRRTLVIAPSEASLCFSPAFHVEDLPDALKAIQTGRSIINYLDGSLDAAAMGRSLAAVGVEILRCRS